MFKKFLSLLIIFVFAAMASFAEESYTLKSSISVLGNIPKEFYGTWRVSSELVSTNAEGTFKQKNVDLWNLSRHADVITLDNPFSGAKASITIDEVDDKLIKFKKRGDYDSQKLTDIVQLNLDKETFSGTNTIILETLSNIDKSVIKSERATYKLMGEKISGSGIK
jgi:hypothetical protein